LKIAQSKLYFITDTNLLKYNFETRDELIFRRLKSYNIFYFLYRT